MLIPRSRRAAALLCLPVFAVGVAACGDDDGGGDSSARRSTTNAASTFKRDGQAASKQLTAIGNRLGTVIQGARRSTDAKLAQDFEKLADDTAAVDKRISALKPPTAAGRRAVSALGSALPTVRRDLDAVGVAARSHDGQAAKSSTETLVRDSAAVRTANNALKRAVGLPVTSPGSSSDSGQPS